MRQGSGPCLSLMRERKPGFITTRKAKSSTNFSRSETAKPAPLCPGQMRLGQDGQIRVAVLVSFTANPEIRTVLLPGQMLDIAPGAKNAAHRDNQSQDASRQFLKSARSLATTFCFVKGESLRSLRPAPGNQYSQFDRIHGLLPAGAPVVHATGHRLRIVLWRILGPSNRLSLGTQLSEGSWSSIQLPPATRN
jgi:hypothetical protein